MTHTPDTAGELDARYSGKAARPTPWARARRELESAGVYWLSTVRPDGRPHVTPLIAVWRDGALHFCTGPEERKARNLADNPQCTLTTGTNDLNKGLDVVVEGRADRVGDEALLAGLADDFAAKYGEVWRFEVRDGAFHHEGGSALVFGVAPVTAFGFERGGAAAQTRWRFSATV
ncbi:pyridoxamine 5'-phosphate oxidase family protein [Nocardiopsis halophila]|uniref:pyridoxamine 5'-phosphate oxidase family protein n=1 Tax=Nocardiopsis halophila TaxID=141692 RepID=UPI0003483330|nr:pyridoxamine 5'-phosphate oxidase family protein [Nocardiopsis halophila]